MNGHVGEKADGFEGVHGGFGWGQRNDGGERFLEVADASGLVLANTMFPVASEDRVTYSSGEVRSQIDYVAVKAVYVGRLKASRVVEKECVGQHKLVLAELGGRSDPEKVKKDRARVKVWRLRDVGVQSAFRSRCQKGLSDVLAAGGGVEELWRAGVGVMMGALEGECGVAKGESRREAAAWWWSDEAEAAVDRKRAMFAEWRRTRGEGERLAYVAARRGARRAVAVSKAAGRDRFLSGLEAPSQQARLFRVARKMITEGRDVVARGTVLRVGEVVRANEEGVREAFATYFRGLLNVARVYDGVGADAVEGAEVEIMEDEVRVALAGMKGGKAAGPSGLTADVMKAGGDAVVLWLLALFRAVWREGTVPDGWRESLLVPVYKGKGDPLSCGSYRAIKLLEHAMKVMEKVLERRLRGACVCRPDAEGFYAGEVYD